MLSRLTMLFALTAYAAALTSPRVVDLNGRPVDPLIPGASAVVLFFAATDCPISNRYLPEIDRLSREFTPRGVHFWVVYPNPADTPEAVRSQRARFGVTLPALLDTHQELVSLVRATVTPEVAVLSPASSGSRPVYVGRIDDRYLSFGKERPQASVHDLETALHALLSGTPVHPAAGEPVGCSIISLQR